MLAHDPRAACLRGADLVGVRRALPLALLDRLERAKHYTSICNSAPSEVLALIALRAKNQILARNQGIVAANLPLFDAFFAARPDLFEWQRPQGGCVAYPRYLGTDGVDAMCTNLVEDEGVLLLPARIYESALNATPNDHFRVGVGRFNPGAGLDRWASWLATRN